VADFITNVSQLEPVYLNAGDDLPAILLDVTAKSTGLPVNFLDPNALWTTPTFSLRRGWDLSGSPAIALATAVFDPDVTGRLRYDWFDGDTDALGDPDPDHFYVATFRCFDPSGREATFPADVNRIVVFILPAIA